MATLMKKRCLLEYAHIGHLLLDIEIQEMKQDRIQMGKLWNEIISTHHEEIDCEAMLQKIKSLRLKYKENNNKNEVINELG